MEARNLQGPDPRTREDDSGALRARHTKSNHSDKSFSNSPENASPSRERFEIGTRMNCMCMKHSPANDHSHEMFSGEWSFSGERLGVSGPLGMQDYGGFSVDTRWLPQNPRFLVLKLQENNTRKNISSLQYMHAFVTAHSHHNVWFTHLTLFCATVAWSHTWSIIPWTCLFCIESLPCRNKRQALFLRTRLVRTCRYCQESWVWCRQILLTKNWSLDRWASGSQCSPKQEAVVFSCIRG